MNPRIIAVLIFIFCLTISAIGQDNMPVPSPDKQLLFYVQRSTNTNTIAYELKYDNGNLDQDNPIHPYWILFAEHGKEEDLNYIQRKFAYGIKSNKISDNHYELKFVSYKKYNLELMQGADNKMHVFSTINNKKVILTRIYLKINGGTFWFPNVEYFEVTGIDPSNNSVLKERLSI